MSARSGCDRPPLPPVRRSAVASAPSLVASVAVASSKAAHAYSGLALGGTGVFGRSAGWFLPPPAAPARAALSRTMRSSRAISLSSCCRRRSSFGLARADAAGLLLDLRGLAIDRRWKGGGCLGLGVAQVRQAMGADRLFFGGIHLGCAARSPTSAVAVARAERASPSCAFASVQRRCSSVASALRISAERFLKREAWRA